MRNILLGAKYFAQQTNSVQITIEHLIKSLACLQAVDRKAYEQVLEVLQAEETDSRKPTFTLELLLETADKPRISYTSEVNDFIQTLKIKTTLLVLKLLNLI